MRTSSARSGLLQSLCFRKLPVCEGGAGLRVYMCCVQTRLCGSGLTRARSRLRIRSWKVAGAFRAAEMMKVTLFRLT